MWDGRSPDSPVHTLSAHQAAVKAISWCPWQPKTLASGGGTNDREIRFWNSATGSCINSVDTGTTLIELSHYNIFGKGGGSVNVFTPLPGSNFPIFRQNLYQYYTV